MFIATVQERLKKEGGDEGERLMNETKWDDANDIADLVLSANTIGIKNKATAEAINRASMNYIAQIWKKRCERLGGETKIRDGQLQIDTDGQGKTKRKQHGRI